jgi:hypothetical protein
MDKVIEFLTKFFIEKYKQRFFGEVTLFIEAGMIVRIRESKTIKIPGKNKT